MTWRVTESQTALRSAAGAGGTPVGDGTSFASSAADLSAGNPDCEECGGTGFIKVPDVDDLTDDDNCPCWMGRCNCASCTEKRDRAAA